jgi:hypothetical protein
VKSNWSWSSRAGLLVALAFIAAGLGSIAATSSFGIPIVIVAAAAGLLILVIAIRPGGSARSGSRAADASIRRFGTLARGTVLEMRPTGRRKGARHEVDLVLEVHVPGRRRYTVERTEWLDDGREREVRIGRGVPVVVDPNQPSHVVLALELSDPDPAAIAALGPIAGGPGGPPTRPRPPGPAGDR